MEPYSTYTDEQLAKFTDEYVRRTVTKLRNASIKEQIYIAVSTFSYNADAFTIGHNIQIGSGNNETKQCSSNLLTSADVIIKRKFEDDSVKPQQVHLALAAPDVEYTEVEDV